MSLYLIYPEGNFIEVSEYEPFLQIGETKYGKPIIVRAFDPVMTFEEAVKLLIVSFDSTIKANLSVAMPLHLRIYEKESLESGRDLTLEENNAYFQTVSETWGSKLKEVFGQLPDFSFSNEVK